MQTKKLIFYMLIAVILVGCSSDADQTIDVTRLVPQTIEVTRMMHQSTATQEPGTLAATPEPSVTLPSITIQTSSTSLPIELKYLDGIIVLTQYYTLLGNGLYEESYQLLSSSQQKQYSFEDYKSFYTHDMKALEIRGIQPYDYWLAKQGISTSPIPADELRYVVFMTYFHNGASWNKGGTPIPDNVTGFETLILEKGEWKMDGFNTAPWLSQP